MDERYKLHLGDCLEVLKSIPDGSVDAVITDPPYGLSFMGKRWDASVPSVEVWQECLRVAKPGAHLLSFAGTRTQHRMAVAIEDAGWFIRDMIAWVYSQGFPKNHDVSKAIDKAAGAEREVVGKLDMRGAYEPGKAGPNSASGSGSQCPGGITARNITAPATEAAKQWQGWGTALKPSLEPITLARKPIDGTVAANVLEHGTGALNIDGCRVEMGNEYDPTKVQRQQHSNGAIAGAFGAASLIGTEIPTYKPGGRWPANLIHDGSDEVAGLFPENSGAHGGKGQFRQHTWAGDGRATEQNILRDDSGSAARFFYCAKASKADRDKDNPHPTVKPTDLMRYLCRLVTPPGGIVLDPFMGSGSTGKAALLEGLRFIGIERDAEYLEIAKRRIEAEARQRTLDFGGA